MSLVIVTTVRYTINPMPVTIKIVATAKIIQEENSGVPRLNMSNTPPTTVATQPSGKRNNQRPAKTGSTSEKGTHRAA
jgi:hypothetical protein